MPFNAIQRVKRATATLCHLFATLFAICKKKYKFVTKNNLKLTHSIMKKSSLNVSAKSTICDSKNRKIYYNSWNGSVVNPAKMGAFGANIISNINENGMGVIEFDAPITVVRDSAFRGRRSLTSITIPDSVTKIGYYAFEGCSSLISVIIPNNVTSIGNSAFAGCDSLTSVIIPNSVTSIGHSAFHGCSSMISVIIPDNVTLIGNYTFCDCSSLKSVIIPNSVTSIGNYTFDGCDNLASVTIPDGVTSIGDGAFSHCDSLISVTIPDSVTKIGRSAFSGCRSLTSVTISNSVTLIRDGAFCECCSLTSVFCKSITPPLGNWYIFSHYDNGFKPIGCTIYVPRNSVSAYKLAKYWRDYADYIVGYDF